MVKISGSKVRRPCQSTIVGAARTERRHSDRNLRTAQFKKGDKKKHWMNLYHYRMDVYTHFKQLVKCILHPMTPLKGLMLSSISHHQVVLNL